MSLPAPTWPSAPPTYEAPATLSSLRPYLTLPYILSLTWLAYPIVSILFVAFRLQLSLSSAQNAVQDAKDSIMAGCKAAEQSATATASLPRYMAIGTNKQIIDAVQATITGSKDALILAITALEAIINFFIDSYRSSFLCFLELIIRGGLSVLISAVQELQKFIALTMKAISSSIQNDIGAANSAINGAIKGINKSPFGPHIHLPQVTIPSVSLLDNVTLSSTFETALTNLNSSIPSVKALRNMINDLVDTPFVMLKKEINDTFSHLSFNISVLPVPQMNTVSFCNELSVGSVDKLATDMVKVTQIGTILLIILAVLLLAFHFFLEWYKWRSLRKSLQRTRSAWATDPTVYHVDPVNSTPSLHMTDHNLLTLHGVASHPLLSRLSNVIAARCHLTPSQFVHLQFFIHYVFHPPALACFIMGFFGILSVELQLITLGIFRNGFSAANGSSSSINAAIASSMNAAMMNQSVLYSHAVNTELAAMQKTIDDSMFGWVNGTTHTLNNTIVKFYDDVQQAIHSVLGHTPFDQPVQEFIRCLIGSKIQSIENVLAFLSTLRVTLPIINETVLLLSPAQVSEAAQPISAAAVGSGGSAGVVGRVVDRYVSDLKKERLMFCIFLGIWGVVVFNALCIILWHSYIHPLFPELKRKKWQEEQRGNFDTVPWTDLKEKEPHFAEEKADHKKKKSQKTFFPGLKKWAEGLHWPRLEGRTSQPSQDDSPHWKMPTKLMAVGRNALGRERLVPDPVPDQDPEVQSRKDVVKSESIKDDGEVFENKVFEDKGEVVEVKWEEEGDPWWRRLLNRWGSIEDDLRDQAPLLVHRRTGASNLTIETNGIQSISQRDHSSHMQDGLEVGEVVHEPASAWSISPAARPTPWIRPLPALISLRSKQKSLSNAASPQLAKVVPTRPHPPSQRLSIPIHYGFVRPPSVSPRSPISPTPHTTSSLKLLPEIVEDPFATCFDDDYRVPLEPPAKRVVSSPNPFGDSVGSPRAV